MIGKTNHRIVIEYSLNIREIQALPKTGHYEIFFADPIPLPYFVTIEWHDTISASIVQKNTHSLHLRCMLMNDKLSPLHMSTLVPGPLMIVIHSLPKPESDHHSHQELCL